MNTVLQIIDGPWIDGFLRDAALGASYSAQLLARNARPAVRWAVVAGALPAGWALNASTGAVTGDADTAGNYDVTISLTDATGRFTRKRFTFKVVALPLEVTGTLDDFGVGEVYSDALLIEGGIAPYTLVSAVVPDGITPSVSDDDLLFLGLATGAGLGPGLSFDFDVIVTVEDSVGTQFTFTQTREITVPPVVVSWVALPDATVGEVYDEGEASATGGSGGFPHPGYTYSLDTAPSWLTIDPDTGITDGTPDSGDVGTGITVTVRATDVEGNYGTATDTLDVEDVVTDPYWSDVVLLLNAAGADGSTTIVDATGNTAWTAVGDAQVDTSLGHNVLLFDGTGDWVAAPTGTMPSILQLGGGSDFSIDFIVKTNGTGTYAICGNLNDLAGQGHYWVILNSTYLGLHTVQFGTESFGCRFGAAALDTTTEHHIEISRSGSSFRCFVDGVQLGSTVSVSGTWTGTLTPDYRVGAAFVTGGSSTYRLNGHIRALRITYGSARNTSNFTPPTAPFPEL